MKQRGWLLLEMAIVLGVLGFLMHAGLRIGNAHFELRQIKEERRTVQAIRRGLLAYVTTNGRLPSPVAGGVPFDQLGMVNVSRRDYAYDVEPQFLLPPERGGPEDNPAAMDMRDGYIFTPGEEPTAIVAARVSVVVHGDTIESRLTGPIILARLVRVGMLP